MTETRSGAGAIPRKELPQGARAPVLGLGTWQLTGSLCRDVVADALAMGYRHIDTAEAYDNEEDVGQALSRSGVERSDVFLVTKAWFDHLGGADLVEACRRSLRRLGTEYVDLYLVHWPSEVVPVEETVGALRELRDAGHIGAWGVCNFTRGRLRKVLDLGRPAVNQVEIHPFLVQADLYAACEEWGVPLTGYSPLARGRVTGDRVLREIGEDHGKTAAQVALRWSLDRGRMVIPKASGTDHLRENLDVFDFSLTEGELDRIDALDAGERIIDPGWADFDE